MIEWLIVSLPLLWLGSLAIDLSDWHSTRQQLALAAQQATVYASLTGGRSAAIKKHLIQHLPKRIHGELKICVTDPVNHLMTDFKDHRLSQRLGQAVIRHDHIAEQHRRFLAKGWKNGRGPRSQQSISTANILHVSVTLRLRPTSPLIRYFLPTLSITSHHKAVMQSHRTHNPKACVTVR